MASPELRHTPSTTVRVADRASYDRDLAHRVLDDGFVAHVGFVVDGRPFVIPMVYGRDGERLLLHGAVATRVMRALDQGAEACVTVTHVDGLVLARSQFHHSVNYRSVVVLGRAQRLRDSEAERALEVIVDHAVPGRSSEARSANRVESRQTMVLCIDIDEASVKVRTGGPHDEAEDLDLQVWAGVLPLSVQAGEPVADEQTSATTEVPESLRPWRRP